MAEQRLWWIKLSDRFMTSETVDFLMSQKNGAEYVVLYQMLCLKTINTDGELSRKLGEIIVQFDEEKIQRDCKYFSIDTVRMALMLYQKLGLVYRQENGILRIADFDRLVGSEMPNAERMRQLRARRALEIPSQCDAGCDEIVTLRERYKDKDKKEKSIKEKSGTSPQDCVKSFKKPTLEEIETYCKERNNTVNPQQFIDFYESKGWYIGKNKMKDWKAAVRTWEQKREPQRDYDERNYTVGDFQSVITSLDGFDEDAI